MNMLHMVHYDAEKYRAPSTMSVFCVCIYISECVSNVSTIFHIPNVSCRKQLFLNECIIDALQSVPFFFFFLSKSYLCLIYLFFPPLSLPLSFSSRRDFSCVAGYERARLVLVLSIGHSLKGWVNVHKNLLRNDICSFFSTFSLTALLFLS